MKKVFILLCCCIALVCNTSCEQYVELDNNFGTPNVNHRVQALIQQARMGNVEAYDSLAVCYRDGDGVEKSMLNMLFMKILSCQKSGKDVDGVLESLDSDHPLRLLTEILDAKPIYEIPQEKVARLRSVSPADALIYDAFLAVECENDTLKAKDLLVEAERNGSEVACILQLFLHDESNDKIAYERDLLRFAGRFPLFYNILGNMKLRSDGGGELQQAAEYYRLADKSGMLTEYGARSLLFVYRQLEGSGEMECDEQDMERLKTLAH